MVLASWLLVAGGVSSAADDLLVNYVAQDSIYLNAGAEEGITEGMELDIKRLREGAARTEAEVVGRVRVIAVASHSSAGEVLSGQGEIRKGDHATLSAADAATKRYLQRSGNTRRYAQVVSFSDLEDLDPLKDEQRAYVPKPPLGEINRVRGQIRIEHSSLLNGGAGLDSHSTGLVLRADMTRIGGTYWNFRGYWRGRIQSRETRLPRETLQDLVNRTYTIALTYNNPYSKNTFGVGRMLLPWASSLSTLDGAYYGRRVSTNVTLGAFGGSTPDPRAWDYNPDRQIAGAFASFQSGSFEGTHYIGTFGLAHTRRRWLAERQFLFLENGLVINRNVSVFQSMEVDHRSKGRFGGNKGGPVLSRSFVTLRVQPVKTVAFDLNHSYFRSVPTFDDRLIGIGLVDNLLFQGINGGVRVQLPRQSAIYGSLGRSDRQSDEGGSWNYLLGFTYGQVPFLDARADVRFSRFSSAFGSGRYYSAGLTRYIGEALRAEVRGGRQEFHSPFTRQNRSYWVNGNLDWLVGRHYAAGAGFTWYQGDIQRYNQIFLSFGYRF